MPAELEPLDRVIQDKFLPAVFGRELQGWEKELVKVAPKKGGLGVRCPTETAEDVFQLSVEGSAVLVAAMRHPIFGRPPGGTTTTSPPGGTTTSKIGEGSFRMETGRFKKWRREFSEWKPAVSRMEADILLFM